MPAANFYGKKPDPNRKNKPRGKPFQPGNRANPHGRPKGSLSAATIRGREFWERLVNDEQYQSNVWDRAMQGELAPAMETMGWYYGSGGKPTERVDVTVTQGKLEEMAKQEPEKFAALSEQIRAAVALLAEVEKP